jgi:hypothetical protein
MASVAAQLNELKASVRALTASGDVDDDKTVNSSNRRVINRNNSALTRQRRPQGGANGWRLVSAVSVRVGCAMLPEPSFDPRDGGLDLDTHADMAILSSNCYVFEETGNTVNVFSYDPKLGSTTSNVISRCFSYDDPTSGRVILLNVHQGLHMPHLGYSLIPPLQIGGLHLPPWTELCLPSIFKLVQKSVLGAPRLASLIHLYHS